MSQRQVILSFNQVSYSYDNSLPIFKKISFDVKQGEMILILGLSGTGKSTLLKCANRLVDISEGIIYYNGQDINKLSPLLLRQEVSYLPQIPFLIEGTVKENLLLSFHCQPQTDNIDEQLHHVLSEVGLTPDYLLTLSQKLSVGEKQRVALARTLLNQFKILLLDEPNSALDQINSQIMIQTLQRIKSQKGVTMIIVTHQLNFAKELGGRYLVLEKDQMKEVSKPDFAFTHDWE